MTETPQQEVYRLQEEISKRLSRINQIMGEPHITDVVIGTTSTRMRRYMNAVSDKQGPQPGAEVPYVQFPEPARVREPAPGED